MPGNILNADVGFPQFREGMTEEQKLNQVMNYLYMLLEQLRYTLANLDADNFNETGLQEIANSIATPLLLTYNDGITSAMAKIQGVADATQSSIQLITNWIGVDEEGKLVSSAAEIRQKTDENAASISLLTQFKKTVEDGTIESIAGISAKADANEASIISLAQFRQTVENGTISSIAEVREKADANEADITLLAQWKTTAQGDIDDLTQSVALIDAKADENGASITQIVEAVGEDGEVTAASIAVAVSGEESFINLVADTINAQGVVTFTSLENDGESVINGNNILLKLDGSDDDGETSIDSENGLNFIYQTAAGKERDFARIYTSVEGTNSDITSRYALNLLAESFKNTDGDTVYPSIKLLAEGRVSVEGQYGIYFNAYAAEGYITFDATDNVRIFPARDYNDLRNATGESYCFCTDGIYYNGEKIVSV